jgi:hypothetical protein
VTPLRKPPKVGVLLEAVREKRYAGDALAFFSEVRNRTGGPGDVLRFADAIVIDATAPDGTWWIEGFEVKRFVGDLDHELRHPEKSEPFRLFCQKWWLVVPFLMRDAVLARLARIPEAWGVLVVDGGFVEVLREATERRGVERPTDAFLKSLIRKASTGARGAWPRRVADVPIVEVARTISTNQVECLRGHVIDKPPLAKGKPGEPRLVPCVRCGQEEMPAAPTAALATIAKASPDDLGAYEEAVLARRAELTRAQARGAA